MATLAFAALVLLIGGEGEDARKLAASLGMDLAALRAGARLRHWRNWSSIEVSRWSSAE